MLKILILTVFAMTTLFAKDHFTMTVVKSATVATDKTPTPIAPAMKCSTLRIQSLGVNRMGWKNSSVPQHVLDLGPGRSIWATRNSDDGFLNSVTLWLGITKSKTTTYFALTDEIHMARWELPQISVNGSNLTVKADTLTYESDDEEILTHQPTRYGQIALTITLRSIAASGLDLTTNHCRR